MQGESFVHKGFTFTFAIEPDTDHAPPWEEYDGHGIVSDWTTRDPEEGEKVLAVDRGHRRYYDIQGTVAIAIRDGWGCRQGTGEGLSDAEKTALAVDQDYEYCRGWANNEWQYIGVVVTLRGTKYSASLWGIESDADDYHREVARDLADDVIAQLPSYLATDVVKLEAMINLLGDQELAEFRTLRDQARTAKGIHHAATE